MAQDEPIFRLIPRIVRSRANVPVQAVFDQSVLNCHMRNLSPVGANLSFPAGANLPDAFYLEVPGGRERIKVAVRWRSARAVGVSFETSGSNQS